MFIRTTKEILALILSVSSVFLLLILADYFFNFQHVSKIILVILGKVTIFVVFSKSLSKIKFEHE
jgi:hypothetical protein